MTGGDGIAAVVLDWDGVLRHWDGRGERDGEHAEGLPPGAIAHAAYGTDAYEYAKLGIYSDRQWREEVAAALAARFDGRGREAVRRWRADRGRVVDGAAVLLDRLRQKYAVALLSDSTDILTDDLETFGLAGHFDHVFVSAQLGMTKPAPVLYRHAAAVLDLAAARILVVDDLPVNLPGAASIGMAVRHLPAGSPLSRLVHDLLQEEHCSASG
ncbi:HAD family hydrolase [Nocardia sp. alder85J]|uniref:HAD family hydrolase n=1 Tax=Nocardia sp. alder85J TaxID=2862949 RepID=UPI001CD468F1|nr:HAD-IA family hydrolase [Nocardia sp. alder85J]MCX4097769.1 HAD-IA family hydrolase [Nocardia sp. alder85J]